MLLARPDGQHNRAVTRCGGSDLWPGHVGQVKEAAGPVIRRYRHERRTAHAPRREDRSGAERSPPACCSPGGPMVWNTCAAAIAARTGSTTGTWRASESSAVNGPSPRPKQPRTGPSARGPSARGARARTGQESWPRRPAAHNRHVDDAGADAHAGEAQRRDATSVSGMLDARSGGRRTAARRAGRAPSRPPHRRSPACARFPVPGAGPHRRSSRERERQRRPGDDRTGASTPARPWPGRPSPRSSYPARTGSARPLPSPCRAPSPRRRP